MLLPFEALLELSIRYMPEFREKNTYPDSKKLYVLTLRAVPSLEPTRSPTCQVLIINIYGATHLASPDLREY